MIAALVLAAALADTPPAAAPGEAVDGVVVTARKPVAGDLQQGVIDYRPEFFVPIRPASALDMVNWLPGFVFEDTRDMRGLEASGGNVLIDGKPPTSKTDTLTTVLKRIPAEQVERVDLIVGGAPGIDMHGRSVIANVVLKAHDKPLRTLTAAGSIDTHGNTAPDLLYTHADKRGGRELNASIEYDSNIAIFPTFGYGPWVRRDGTGATEFAAHERFRYIGPYLAGTVSYEFPLAGGQFRVSSLGKLSHDTLDEFDSLTGQAGDYGFRHNDDYRQIELGLHYERTVGPVQVEAQTLDRYRRQATTESFYRPPGPTADRVDSHALEDVQRLVLRYRPTATLTLEGSAEHARNDSASDTRATDDGQPVTIPVADVDLVDERWDGGATLTWKPNGAFSLDAALKAETEQLRATGDETLDNRLSYAKPRLALTWSPDKDSQVRLRAEYEVQQFPLGAVITFNEYESGQFRNGNADIRPPRAAVAEAVFERHFWSTGDLTVTVRYKGLQDVLDEIGVAPASGSPYEILSNIGSGRESDLIGNLMVPLSRFGLGSSSLRAVVTWQRARVTDPLSGLPRNLSNFPEMQQELHFAQDLPRLRLNWGIDAFYRGGTTLYRPFGNETAGGWTHVNLFVERRFGEATSLRLEVQNLPGQAPKGVVSVFQGFRDQSALLYVDDKRLSVGPLLYLRLRRSF